MTTVRELFTRLGFKVDNASLNKAEQSIDRVKDGADRMATAVRNAALAFGGFAAVQGLVRVADTMQSLRARISLLPQTIDDAGLAFDVVADRATKARTSIEAYGTLYVRLAGATKDYLKTQDEVLMVTDAISNALVVGGAAASEAESATLQLSQAFQKGKLDGDEFKSFMENLSVDFKDKLAKELGTTAGELYKLSEQGKLSARDLAEAFKRMAPEIEKQMLSIPMTWGQAMTVIENRWSKAIDRINRKSMVITTMANGAINAFDKIGNAIGIFIDKLGGAENAVRLVGAAIVAAFGAKAIAVLAAFRTASLLALWPYVRMAAVITLATLALEDLYVWVQGGNSLAGQYLGTWEEFKVTLENVWTVIKNVGGAIMLVSTAFAIAKGAAIAFNAVMMIYRGVIIAATIVQGIFNAVMLMNPMGLFLIAITAVIAAGVAIMANWKSIVAFFKPIFAWFGEKLDWLADKFGFLGTAAKIALNPAGALLDGAKWLLGTDDKPSVAPSKMSSQGQGRGSVANVNTTVNMTVPPGTTKEQQAAINRTAQMAFAKPSNALARDLSARGR